MSVFQSNGFTSFLKNVIGAQGNTPGYPNQFKYLPEGKFNLETIPENLDIFTEPQAHIPRESRTGHSGTGSGLSAMVSDVPFDYNTLEKNTNKMYAAGFAAIVVGIAMVLVL